MSVRRRLAVGGRGFETQVPERDALLLPSIFPATHCLSHPFYRLPSTANRPFFD